MHRYRVVSPLDHDLVAYPVGAIITCDDQLADSLIEKGVIWPEIDPVMPAPTIEPASIGQEATSPVSAQLGQGGDVPVPAVGGDVSAADTTTGDALPSPPMPPAATDQTGAGAAEGKAAPASAPASKPRAKRTKA